MPWNFDHAEALDRCRRLGGPADQQALLTLLQGVQEHCGGALPMEALEEIACAFSLRVSFLSAMVRRYPSLRPAGAAHRLTVCCGPRCAGARLASFVERTYDVRSGGFSSKGGFQFERTGCQKACRHGPCITWDGVRYTGATPERIRSLVTKKP